MIALSSLEICRAWADGLLHNRTFLAVAGDAAWKLRIGAESGDVGTANFSAKFGIEQKSAIGDMGAFSRLAEGDPQISISLSVFLESDELQQLVDANATVHTAVVLHGDCGDELHLVTPETELSSSGPAISGKGGLMQDLTVMAFVESAPSILEFVLVNRVASYA